MTTAGATTPLRAVRAEQRRASPSGWWGMVLLIATEATLFGTLVGTYFYLRFNSAHWPQGGAPEPKVLLPLVLTAVLVATSIPMQLASRLGRSRRRGGAWWMLLSAFAVQGAYLVVQLFVFADDLSKLHPEHTAYASIYALLGGTAHAHAAVGLLLDAFLLVRLATGLTAYRLVSLRAVTIYWHFVNAATVVVLLTQISPRL